MEEHCFVSDFQRDRLCLFFKRNKEQKKIKQKKFKRIKMGGKLDKNQNSNRKLNVPEWANG